MQQKYRIALVLGRDKYIDLSSVNNLFNSKRTFVLFHWGPVKYRYSPGGQEGHGWVPWLHYSGSKWRRVDKSKKRWKHLFHESTAMMKAHMFFESEDEFKEWVGPELYKKMMIDLL